MTTDAEVNLERALARKVQLARTERARLAAVPTHPSDVLIHARRHLWAYREAEAQRALEAFLADPQGRLW